MGQADTRAGRQGRLTARPGKGAARFAAALLFACCAGVALAQGAYPAAPVRFLVSFPPGGPLDIMARTLAERLQAALKQPFVVENKPGASGNVGADQIAKSAPDGYNVLFTIDTVFTVNPTLYATLPYKLADLKPLFLIGSSGLMVAVHPSVGAASLAELVARGRTQTLNFSSGGNGSPGHITSAILAAKTGVKVNHVPYKGNTPAVLAIVSGEVQAGILATPGLLPHVQSGKVRALAVTGRKRSPVAPDVPTVIEAGFPDLEFEVAYLSLVPAATPPAVVATLQQAMAEALAQPAARERLEKLDVVVEADGGPAVAARLDALRQRYAPIIRDTGMKVD